MHFDSDYDDIVIGGGSAGAVLAARLSEDPARRVALVEAGPHYGTHATTPADVLEGGTASFPHSWGYAAQLTAGRRIPFPQGRVTGGTSALSGTSAVRGTRQDFEEWARLGNPGWAWEKVLPRYMALEDDLDFGNSAYHGRGGPVPIKRWRNGELTPLQEAFYAASLAAGQPDAEDHNFPESTGVGPLPAHRSDAVVRVSTAAGYLWPARDRGNLSIVSGTTVNKVLFRYGKAFGVRVSDGSGWRDLRARRVVLAAGVIGSPAVLMRSGVGPAEELEELGIGVQADLTGVGAGLADQPRVAVLLAPVAGEGAPAASAQVVTRTSSEQAGGRFNDLSFTMVDRIDLDHCFPSLRSGSTARTAFGLTASVRRVRSRGRVALASADPAVAPLIDLGHLSDPRDYDLLAQAVRDCWELAQSPKIRDHARETVGLDEDVLDSPEALRRYIDATADSTHNAVGTVRMGPAHDRTAVVDERCAVRGVENLYVADASIMPAMVCADVHLTVVMIGEHAAAMLRAEQ